MKKTSLFIFFYLLCLSLHAQRHEVRREGRVLAHSLSFNPNRIDDEMPDGLKEILRAYQTKARYAERQKANAVAPLLKSIRHQEDPFNRSCPYYTYDNGTVSTERCIVGCVATCIEQVLSYYRYPDVLADTLHGWETENYKIPDVMPGTKIDWDNIADDYRNGYTKEQAKAVADLSYWCGVASHMNWGLSSSGTNLYRAFEPLWKAFNYKTLALVSRAMYSTPKWNALLRNELENGRPICYTGHNMSMSGHAFNIDGVDENGYYHLNWGYGGDYDGYFDLDYLNPFESYGDATDMGQNEGFFNNQMALFLHPEDFVIDITDTLTTKEAFEGVRVDDISFRREPDTQGYVIADFSMTNITNDSLNFTFEVLTYLPTDTAIFYQADYVGLSAVNLAPGEQKTWPVYCKFTKTGERIFSFSADDETLPYKLNLNIKVGTAPQLQFGEVGYQLLKFDDDLTASFSLDVTNQSTEGYAGDLITYCLFPKNENIDTRHWEVISLPGGDTHTLSTSFHHLEDGGTYVLYVRCPWDVQREFDFTVRSEEATDGVTDILNSNTRGSTNDMYDLTGRRFFIPKGIYIKNGKKFFIR